MFARMMKVSSSRADSCENTLRRVGGQQERVYVYAARLKTVVRTQLSAERRDLVVVALDTRSAEAQSGELAIATFERRLGPTGNPSFYSYRSASMGSSFAARRAGIRPKTSPMLTETATATSVKASGGVASTFMARVTS